MHRELWASLIKWTLDQFWSVVGLKWEEVSGGCPQNKISKKMLHASYFFRIMTFLEHFENIFIMTNITKCTKISLLFAESCITHFLHYIYINFVSYSYYLSYFWFFEHSSQIFNKHPHTHTHPRKTHCKCTQHKTLLKSVTNTEGDKESVLPVLSTACTVVVKVGYVHIVHKCSVPKMMMDPSLLCALVDFIKKIDFFSFSM